MSRSRETLGSPPSILATRDWLELSSLATCVWLRRRLLRLSRSVSESRSRSSTYAASAGDKPRKSSTVPSLHPRFSSQF